MLLCVLLWHDHALLVLAVLAPRAVAVEIVGDDLPTLLKLPITELF
jgi:hypothetical protein